MTFERVTGGPNRRLEPRDPIHVRKTLQATGAGELDIGTVTIFTLTGRVSIQDFSVFCTEDLVGAATLDFGVVGDTNFLCVQVANATTIDVNEWINVASGAGVVGAIGNSLSTSVISGSIILTVGAADVTDGTLVVDITYRPLTSDGELS